MRNLPVYFPKTLKKLYPLIILIERNPFKNPEAIPKLPDFILFFLFWLN